MGDCLKDRLLQFIEAENIEKARFEKETGLSNGFVDKVGKSIRSKSLDKIRERYPLLNIDWLLTGVGPMMETGKINIIGDSNISNTGTIKGDINSNTQLLKKRIAELEKVNKELTELLKSTSSMEDEFERLFSDREIARLQKENKQLIEENKRLIEDSGYYKGLLDLNNISYKQ